MHEPARSRPFWHSSSLFLAGSARPARADITAFLGLSPTPERHFLRGFSGGLSLLIVGFEFEYSNLGEDDIERLPGLKTYSGNVFVQTPVEIMGTQFYAHRRRRRLPGNARRWPRRRTSASTWAAA